MALKESIDHLLTTHNFKNNLDIIKHIILELKIMPDYPIILIGGTNGKGSVCAYLTTILTGAGYNVGSFTSPHVLRYNERISINNVPIDDITLNSALEVVMNVDCHAMATNDNYNLGLFKTFTLAAHLIFMARKIDIAIIEVGIGGKSDITNLFEPLISAITNVDYDHSDLLGDTLEKIGEEKSGIFRENKWGFFGSSKIPKSVINTARQIGTKLQQFGLDFGIIKHELCFDVFCQERTFYSLPYPAGRGFEQTQNAALAIAILSKLHNLFPVSLASQKTGLLASKLIGRFQLMPGLPQNILDVAHNLQAVTHMLENMLKLPFAKSNYAVFGIAKDKDASAIIRVCNDKFDKWFIAKTNSERSMPVTDLARLLIENGVKPDQIVSCTTISEAYAKAHSCAKDTDRIISFGSFLVVEEVYNTILKQT